MATIYGRKHTIRRGYLLVPQEMTGPGGKVYTVDLEYQVFDSETGDPISDSRTVEGEQHGSRLVVGDPHRDTRLFEYTIATQPTSESKDYWRGYQAALGDRQWHKEGQSKKYYANTQAWWDGYNQGHRDKRDPSAGYAPNARKRPAKTRKHSFAGYDFTTDDSGTKIHRETIDTSTRADYGYDHVGDGMVRMVPSGDVVSLEEAIRLLPRLGGSGGSNSGFKLNGSDEYRGLRIEAIENATQLGYYTGEGMRRKRGKGRDIGRQYLIHLGEAGDGGTKMVSTMRAAREYIDDYLGPEHTPNHAATHYVWLLDYRGVPLDTEGPYGPMSLTRAEQFARIGAKEGDHDRVVSIGEQVMSDGFEILRRYRRGTGERIL